MEEVKEIKSKEAKVAEIIDVPTATAEAIKIEDGTIISPTELLVRIYNKLSKIEKAVV